MGKRCGGWEGVAILHRPDISTIYIHNSSKNSTDVFKTAKGGLM